MQAVVKVAPGVGHVELREVPEPQVGPGQVKIAVQATGICGTDLHIYDAEYASRPPVTLGHEMAGRVVEVAPDVTEVAVGDRVTALPFAVTCMRCSYCRQGYYGLCPNRLSFGSGVDGAFAPYLVIPARIVRRLPSHIDDECGALTEPLACCCKAVLLSATVRAGDVAAIVGPGPIGLLALQLAQLQGAQTVLIGTTADAGRLEVGRSLGADYVLTADRDDVPAAVAEITSGEGADVVVECAGAPAATRLAVRIARKCGQLAQMGLHGKPFELDFEQIVYKDLQVIGSFASSAPAWERALTLLQQDRIRLRPLISSVLPLARWEEGFALSRTKSGLKVLLRPGS